MPNDSPPLASATMGELLDEINIRVGNGTVEKSRAQEALRNLTEWIVAAGFPLNQSREP